MRKQIRHRLFAASERVKHPDHRRLDTRQDEGGGTEPVSCSAVRHERQGDIEPCPAVFAALKGNSPAHQDDELAAYGKAEAGATKVACGAVVRLFERSKDVGLLVLRNSHTCIGDRQNNFAGSAPCHFERNMALQSELDGVPRDVDEYLSQAPGIS